MEMTQNWVDNSHVLKGGDPVKLKYMIWLNHITLLCQAWG